MDSHKTRVAVVLTVAIASVLGLSMLALTSYSSTSATTSEGNGTDYDSYLDPCYTCTPTEDDFENLTTFELLAKYPQLSGDPIDNDTGTAPDDGMPAAPEQNMTDTTSFNETLTASNETGMINGSGGNATNSTG